MANFCLKKLQEFRKKIDKIDQKLLKILAERFKVTQKIGQYKKRYSLPLRDKERERQLLKNLDNLAKKLKLNQKLVREIFQAILKTVRGNHRKIKMRK